MNKTLQLSAVVLVWTTFGQTASNAQTFALSDTKDLVLVNVKADSVEYNGRKAVRLTNATERDGFALLRGIDFQDGTIEADIALKITTPPGVRCPVLLVSLSGRGRTPHATNFSICDRETRAQMIKRCETIRCNMSLSQTSTGTDSAGNGLGSMSPIQT